MTKKYYIEKVNYARGFDKIVIPDELKKKLRYQIVLLASEDGYQGYSLSGKNVINVSKDYDSAWVIVRGKEESTCDSRVIRYFAAFFSSICPEIAESMCSKLGQNILAYYHSCYGRKKLQEFKDNVLEMEAKSDITETQLIYDHPRYSIPRLINDLAKSRVMIYTDPGLIGKYRRISRKIKDGSTLVSDKWAKLIGILRNKTRANLSLKVLSKVTVDIPKNSYGIEAGKRELESIRSFTLVVDGTLNMTEIGIKTKDTRLIGKLKRLGILEPLLMEDEYIVKLDKLPTETKKMLPGIYQLGNAEFRSVRSKYICSYLKRLIYLKENKLSKLPTKIPEPEKDEAKIFLEGLGIFGNYYYPQKVETETEKSYKTVEVVGKVYDSPSDITPSITRFINTGSCRNKVAMNILKRLKEETGGMSLDELKTELRYAEREKKINNIYLSELKYQIILGKNLLTREKKSIESKTVNLYSFGVKVSWLVYEREIKV